MFILNFDSIWWTTKFAIIKMIKWVILIYSGKVSCFMTEINFFFTSSFKNDNPSFVISWWIGWPACAGPTNCPANAASSKNSFSKSPNRFEVSKPYAVLEIEKILKISIEIKKITKKFLKNFFIKQIINNFYFYMDFVSVLV